MFKYLVIGRNRFNYIMARWWVRTEQGLWRARAEMSRDPLIVRIEMVELQQETEEKAS